MHVQIRPKKLVDGLKQLTYTETLRRLNLPTLAYRRMCGDMIEIYKHCHMYNHEMLSNAFSRINPCFSRKHDYKLLWNVARDGINAILVNSFKNKLDVEWKPHPIMYNHIPSDL